MKLSRIGLGSDVDFFVENFSTLVASGMGVMAALEAIYEELGSKRMKKIVYEIKIDIEAGSPLWQALKKQELFKEQEISLIKLGEESGRLVENLKVLTMQQRKERSFRSKIRSAMMYPIFVLVLTGVVGVGIAWFILPKLSTVFDQLDVDLPAMTKALIWLGKFLGENGAIAVPAFLLVMLGIFYLVFFFAKTKFVGEWVLMHLPGIKKLILETEMGRFGYVTGTLIDAGLPLMDTLKSLEESTTLLSYRKIYKHLRENLDVGNSFRKSLSSFPKSSKLIPISVQQMIFASEQAGNVPEALLQIGENYESKIDDTTKNLTVILEPILLVVVWLGVVGVALAIILPIYSLVGNFQT